MAELLGATPALRPGFGADRLAAIRKAFGPRARFLIVLLIALVPGALTLSWLGSEAEREARLMARTRVLDAARDIAAGQQALVDTSMGMLAVLGRLPSVQAFEDPRCTATLDSVRRTYAWLSSLYVIDTAGRLHCTQKTGNAIPDALHETVFRNAIATGMPQIDGDRLDAFTGLPVFALVRPIVNDEGTVLFLIAANIKRWWSEALLADVELPRGSVALLVDERGTVLAGASERFPEAALGTTGRVLVDSFPRQDEGVVDSSDLGQVFGFVRLKPRRAVVVIGMPRPNVFAAVQWWRINGDLALLLSSALGLALALVAAKLLLLRRKPRITPDGTTTSKAESKPHAESDIPSYPLSDPAQRREDVTEHLSLRGKELQLAYNAERKANIAKNDFMARMSHELRTPLNAISGFAQVIRDQRFGPDAMARYADYASDIAKSSDHLLSLINELLDLSKIEANRVELNPEPIALPAFLTETLRLLRTEADANRVRLELAPCQADLVLVADRRALTQILLNLLSNSIKYTPHGGRVRLSAVARGNGIVMQVSDTGVGMSPEQLERAFEAFVRSDNPLVRSRDGAGLGLPIAKQLLELQSGRIALKSRVGHGTHATLWLPKSPLARKAQTDIDSGEMPDHALAG